jgi:hypothetical protein
METEFVSIIKNGGQEKMATLKCPVCDWEITDGGVKVTVAGKEITVCCDECATQAIADHEKSAT